MMYEGRPVRKSWIFSLSQSEAMHAILEELAAPLPACSMVMADGNTLHMKPHSPLDIATLSQSAVLCRQYLNLKDGEIALVNDPYCGGASLSDLTLVTAVNFDPLTSRNDIDLLLSVRIAFPKRVPLNYSLDSEGVRIPPTPLGRLDKVNTDLLSAISMHPMAPLHLNERILKTCELLKTTRSQLKSLGTDPGSEFRRSHFKRYLADSGLVFKTELSRLPLGTAMNSMAVRSGTDNIKVFVEVTENHLAFDFAGTDTSEAVNLTELMTFGACVAATYNTFQLKVPFNASTFEHFHVKTPAKTLVAGRAPSGVFRGVQSGLASVSDCVARAFAQLHSSVKRAEGANCRGHFQIEFADGRVFSNSVAGGSGASKEQAGSSALALWSYPETLEAGPEAVEADFPITTTTVGLRVDSKGAGTQSGGEGAVKGYRVQAQATARWIMGPLALAQAGLENAKSASSAGSSGKICIIRADQSTEEFETCEGSVSLQPGDEIRFLASGGGAH